MFESNIELVIGSNACLDVLRDTSEQVVSHGGYSSRLTLRKEGILSHIDNTQPPSLEVLFFNRESDTKVETCPIDMSVEGILDDILYHDTYFIMDMYLVGQMIIREANSGVLGKAKKDWVEIFGQFCQKMLRTVDAVVEAHSNSTKANRKLVICLDAVSFSMVPMGDQNRELVKAINEVYSYIQAKAEKSHLMVSLNHYVELTPTTKIL